MLSSHVVKTRGDSFLTYLLDPPLR
jgi:hypothetical protein